MYDDENPMRNVREMHRQDNVCMLTKLMNDINDFEAF